MNVFWEMLCAEMPCCSFAKTRWKLPGLLLTPFSGIQHPWKNTSQAHGDLMRRIVWLRMWTAGTIPKNIKRAQSMSRTLRNNNSEFRKEQIGLNTSVERPAFSNPPLNEAAFSLKRPPQRGGIGPPRQEANYPRAAGLAARTPLKLLRYCGKTSTHSTQATNAGTMLSGAIVRWNARML